MDKFLTGLGALLFIALVIAGLAMLGAYPTKWIMNYLFNPTLLSHIFTVSRFDFWHAFCLNYIAGALIKSSLTTTNGGRK